MLAELLNNPKHDSLKVGKSWWCYDSDYTRVAEVKAQAAL